mgnify:CR=1 FL=1
MFKQAQTNVINTINNISAFGRAHASEYDFSIDDEVSFTIDTSDVKEVSAIVKTMCVWLKGKNQNIYVERFCNSNESSITILNPMLRTKDMDDDGNPIPYTTIDYDDNERDGSCHVQEVNEHEADGHIIADIWDQVKPGAFRDWVSNTLVRVDGSFVEVEKA